MLESYSSEHATNKEAITLFDQQTGGTMSTPTPHATISPLLEKLPAEIRNQIYDLVLVSDTPLEANVDLLKKHTAILNTCSQIRTEAKDIIFENEFQLTCGKLSPDDLRKWLTSLGARDKLIKHITVEFGLSHTAETQSISWAEKYEHLTVDFDIVGYLRYFKRIDSEAREFAEVLAAAVSAGTIAQNISLVRAKQDYRDLSLAHLRKNFVETIQARLPGPNVPRGQWDTFEDFVLLGCCLHGKQEKCGVLWARSVGTHRCLRAATRMVRRRMHGGLAGGPERHRMKLDVCNGCGWDS